MKTDNANSESTSATTSKSGPSSGKPKPGPTADPDKLTEAEYLTQQAENAKAAIAAAVKELTAKLGEGANPIEWTKRYPWAGVGASAVAGFVAAALLIPSKEEQALAKLAKIERALNPPPPKKEREVSDSVNGDTTAKDARAPTGLLTLLAREAIGAVKPAIISLLTAGVTAKAAKPTQDEMEAAAESADAKQGE